MTISMIKYMLPTLRLKLIGDLRLFRSSDQTSPMPCSCSAIISPVAGRGTVRGAAVPRRSTGSRTMTCATVMTAGPRVICPVRDLPSCNRSRPPPPPSGVSLVVDHPQNPASGLNGVPVRPSWRPCPPHSCAPARPRPRSISVRQQLCQSCTRRIC